MLNSSNHESHKQKRTATACFFLKHTYKIAVMGVMRVMGVMSLIRVMGMMSLMRVMGVMSLMRVMG